MSTPSYRSYSSPEDSRSAPRRSDEPLSRERLIPFPAGSPNGSDARTRQVQRRRPESRDVERSSTARRPRRRRHSTPWLQRNALSLAALSFLFALLGLGFGLVQTLNRPEQTAASPLNTTLASSASPPSTISPTRARCVSARAWSSRRRSNPASAWHANA